MDDAAFGIKGRINRAKYWLACLIYVAAWIVLFVVAVVWIAIVRVDLFGPAGGAVAFWLPVSVLLLAMTWSSIAIGVKRLHDRNESGWWMLVFALGPMLVDGIGGLLGDPNSPTAQLPDLALAIWVIIEVGCLRGTYGPNQYGSDPRLIRTPEAPEWVDGVWFAVRDKSHGCYPTVQLRIL